MKLCSLGTHIVGGHYQAYWKDIVNKPIGHQVYLKREPSNEFDKKAIAVFSNSGCTRQVGYIPSHHAVMYAALFDQVDRTHSTIYVAELSESIKQNSGTIKRASLKVTGVFKNRR